MDPIKNKVASGWFDRETATQCSYRQMILNVRLEFSNLFLRCRIAYLTVRFKLRDMLFQFHIRRLKRSILRMIGESAIQPQQCQCATNACDGTAQRGISRRCDNSVNEIKHGAFVLSNVEGQAASSLAWTDLFDFSCLYLNGVER